MPSLSALDLLQILKDQAWTLACMRSFLEGTWNAPKTHLYQGASTIGEDLTEK